ncbi:MAG: ABC transporter ATP-binding protein [Thermomicrobiales bacterium]
MRAAPGDVLRMVGIEVRRDRRAVLDVPELTVAAGETVAIIGPNGAGKSTLLQVAALLVWPDAGEVWIGGEVATRRGTVALRRRLAMVFQSPLLFDVSVLENVASGPRFHGVGRREAKERARDWLTRFGVDALADRPARAISGGEAQRVALARAFAVEPALLLLDEPFAALDAPTRAELLPDLATRLRETGVAAVIITHDPAEARLLGDRLGVMIDGRIAQIGSPAEVVARPVSPEVSRFVSADLRPGA